MIEVWYALPSAGPAEGARLCLEAWQDQGYCIAVARERDLELIDLADYHLRPPAYRGYQRTINQLARTVLASRPQAQIIVAGADDVFPDTAHTAQEIAQEFLQHFGGWLGVMQPTGHSNWSLKAHLIAWSPWLGREWCMRAYGGQGPFPAMYWHNRADIELAQVAGRLRLWWARPDLRQVHARHPSSAPHLAHREGHKLQDAETYRTRLAQHFPGSGLAPA